MKQITDFRGADLAIALSLIGRDYVHTAARLIDASRNQLFFTVFQSSFVPGKTSKPDVLIDAIIRAHQRGVKVRVLVNFSGASTVTSKNRTLSQHLAERGVPVRAAGRGYLVHGKVLIIDREIVIIGSHNLTQRGLWTNYEASIALHSEAIAGNMIDWFTWLWERCKEVSSFG